MRYIFWMTSDSDSYLPFSQRSGLVPTPPQLKLGEVSAESRRLFYYYISLEIDRESTAGYSGRYFHGNWRRVATDLHVVFFEQDIDKFEGAVGRTESRIKLFVERANYGRLFDLIEFIIRHQGCSNELRRDLSAVFVKSRAAYRVFDGRYIAAIGTEEQAQAFERAISAAEANNASAARTHLIKSGIALRNSDWSGSVRESIHAVEATAKRLAPGAQTLGDALKVLDKGGVLHGRLKEAFAKLYAYSNADENGARHALVFNDVSKVDEADALFMLGACASFVSFLLARER